jgi:2,3-bisphosphoglycerate-dependent phosphoglycerate mutase
VKRVSRRLWLVRHGETDWSAAGRFNGWTDIPLNMQGRQQASSLARELNERRFVTVWSSDLCRATETARLADTEPVLDRRLRELDFGTLEGRTWAELPPRTRDALIDFDAFAAPGGESVVAMRDRVLEFVHALPAGDHLVFTHGGVIRLLSREGIERGARPGEIAVLEFH